MIIKKSHDFSYWTINPDWLNQVGEIRNTEKNEISLKISEQISKTDSSETQSIITTYKNATNILADELSTLIYNKKSYIMNKKQNWRYRIYRATMMKDVKYIPPLEVIYPGRIIKKLDNDYYFADTYYTTINSDLIKINKFQGIDYLLLDKILIGLGRIIKINNNLIFYPKGFLIIF